MRRKEVCHIKGVGFDKGTDDIVNEIVSGLGVSYSHAVRILLRIAGDTLVVYPDILDAYTDSGYEITKGAR